MIPVSYDGSDDAQAATDPSPAAVPQRQHRINRDVAPV
jgi:hypothetical protein